MSPSNCRSTRTQGPRRQRRIGRVRYLGWLMAMTLCFIPIMLIGTGIAAMSSTLAMLALGIVSIAAVVIGIFIGVQRLHDIGWSGWLLLVHLIPVVGSVFALLMLIIPGTQGVNRYGPPPPPTALQSRYWPGCSCWYQ